MYSHEVDRLESGENVMAKILLKKSLSFFVWEG